MGVNLVQLELVIPHKRTIVKVSGVQSNDLALAQRNRNCDQNTSDLERTSCEAELIFIATVKQLPSCVCMWKPQHFHSRGIMKCHVGFGSKLAYVYTFR